MGIGVSIFFLTIGAILKFAIEPDVLGDSVHIDVIGIIFMVAGVVGIAISVFLTSRRGVIVDPEVHHRENPPPV
ncbi:membrane protein [Sphaerisporangium rufum]|uniref:Membrane protein n=1 Tax=Sphaerisporangium rufum TaxID=1381558 RepID=A0A919R1N5_9ACTN|nr:hypothetical protein [Sphaerisporangium rufum]GII77393.1 membrane protein [Sphaerisporangium rufum]